MAFVAWYISPLIATLSILTSLYILRWVKSQNPGSEKIIFVGGAIKEGSHTFLKRMYRTLAFFVIAMSMILLVFLPRPIWSSSYPFENVILMAAISSAQFAVL